MNDRMIIFWLTWILSIAVFFAGIVIGRGSVPEIEPAIGQVNDKCEVEGRCYVQTWVEVSVEDYIGLEVGDEFELK